MTSIQLAQLSTYALYAGMAVLACALVAFTIYMTGLLTTRFRHEYESGSDSQVGADALVGAGAGASAGAAGPSDAGHHAAAPLPSRAADDPEGGVTATSLDALLDGRRRAASGGIGMSLSWLAALILVASIAMRGLAVSRPPVANLFEFTVAGGTATLLTYLVLSLRRPLRWLGVFITLVVLSMLGLAAVAWYVPAAELAPSLKDYWIAIHVPIAIISIGIFTVAFCMLMALLFVERAERRRAAAGAAATPRTGFLTVLPSAAKLDRTAYSLHVAGFPLWTFTIIAGAIWGQRSWGTYWSWDPKEVWSFVIWVLYAAYLHARATSGWKRQTSNYIAIAAYVGILLNTTVVNFYGNGMHSYSGL